MSLSTAVITPILAIVLLFIMVAFLRMLRSWSEVRQGALVAEEDVEKIRLEDAKDRILTTLRDLDFEHRMGKLSDADHKELRTRGEGEAMQVLKALDGLSLK